MLELARSLNRTTWAISASTLYVSTLKIGAHPNGLRRQTTKIHGPLGAQYWSKNLPNNYTARYGILLDMVGGKNAKFYIEQASMAYAPEIVAKVWGEAANARYSNVFINKQEER